MEEGYNNMIEGIEEIEGEECLCSVEDIQEFLEVDIDE